MSDAAAKKAPPKKRRLASNVVLYRTLQALIEGDAAIDQEITLFDLMEIVSDRIRDDALNK